MKMTVKERKVWLSQINRIHGEQKEQRQKELVKQTEYIAEIKSRYSGEE